MTSISAGAEADAGANADQSHEELIPAPPPSQQDVLGSTEQAQTETLFRTSAMDTQTPPDTLPPAPSSHRSEGASRGQDSTLRASDLLATQIHPSARPPGVGVPIHHQHQPSQQEVRVQTGAKENMSIEIQKTKKRCADLQQISSPYTGATPLCAATLRATQSTTHPGGNLSLAWRLCTRRIRYGLKDDSEAYGPLNASCRHATIARLLDRSA